MYLGRNYKTYLSLTCSDHTKVLLSMLVDTDTRMKEICNDCADKSKCHSKSFAILHFCGLSDLLSNVLLFGSIVSYLLSEIG